MELTHNSLPADSDRAERLKKCLESACKVRPENMSSISASANNLGEVVIGTDYKSLKENRFFEPSGFLTSLLDLLEGT